MVYLTRPSAKISVSAVTFSANLATGGKGGQGGFGGNGFGTRGGDCEWRALAGMVATAAAEQGAKAVRPDRARAEACSTLGPCP